MTDLMETTFRSLSQQLPGRVSLQGDKRYIAATSIWAKPLKRMPQAVVHCRTTGDVQAAIRAARDRGLPLSVRGGGHDWAGRALCNGIVIDLGDMNSVVADAANLTAKISGGARASDVVDVTDPLGLAVVTGSAGVVGMTGLTLGGGYGPADRPLRTGPRQHAGCRSRACGRTRRFHKFRDRGRTVLGLARRRRKFRRGDIHDSPSARCAQRAFGYADLSVLRSQGGA